MTITNFMPNGLEFVHSLLVLAGSLLAASGVALWMGKPDPARASGRRGDGGAKACGIWPAHPGCVSRAA